MADSGLTDRLAVGDAAIVTATVLGSVAKAATLVTGSLNADGLSGTNMGLTGAMSARAGLRVPRLMVAAIAQYPIGCKRTCCRLFITRSTHIKFVICLKESVQHPPDLVVPVLLWNATLFVERWHYSVVRRSMHPAT